jgi:hypothetical protein
MRVVERAGANGEDEVEIGGVVHLEEGREGGMVHER